MTGKIFLKLIAGVLGLLLGALAAVDYFAIGVARENYLQNLKDQLAGKCRMLALSLPAAESLDAAPAKRMAAAAGGRITIIRADGKVLVDSEANAAQMENHGTRPEVVDAFAHGVGSNSRLSATLGDPFLYVAVRSADGAAAIRIAVPLSEIDRQVGLIRRKLLVSTAVAFLPAILIAAILARLISRRLAQIMAHAGELARGNFRARLSQGGSSEFGQLASTLNETAEKLQKTVSQLQREHAELERVERIRKDFVINVSHELRTPLASIQGYTETLIDGALHDPEHNMRFLGIIRHNAERLARLTEDLLTLSRIEQKRKKFEFEPRLANSLIHDALEVVRPIAEKTDLRLRAEPAPDNAVVWCDNEAVSQVMSNLLDNAIKYTPSGGEITVGAHEANGMIEFFVRDTGIGIPGEDLPRLFERFYRVDKARSRELGGTGLGLSIVKHLVAAHGGTTRVESTVGRGSTFYFTLPVQPAELDGAALNPEFTAS
ncbi:MAG TPA: ATP-binding protein [Candidatus Acidoferrales bacterium]|nr:ATP-binding protein [Candidatus Acidoferrales bacterium]